MQKQIWIGLWLLSLSSEVLAQGGGVYAPTVAPEKKNTVIKFSPQPSPALLPQKAEAAPSDELPPEPVEVMEFERPSPSPKPSSKPSRSSLPPAMIARFQQATQLLNAICTLMIPEPDAGTRPSTFGDLKIENCPSFTGKTWFKYLLFKQMIDVSTDYEEGCDFYGKIRMVHTAFGTTLKIRHMPPLEKVELDFELNLEKIYDKNQFDTTFEITRGVLNIFKEKPIFFHGSCRVVTPAMDGTHLPGSGGKLVIDRIGDTPTPYEAEFQL